MTEPVTDPKAAGDRIVKNIPAWAPPVPAPIDVKSVNWAVDRLPRQLGRQPGRVVAHARVRRVGDRRSAHGQRAHSRAAQPVHRQPAAAAVSVHERRSRRARVKARRSSRRTCASCHTPTNQTIYPASKLGVDANRTMVNTSVSRYGLAALVMEACSIYGLNQQGTTGRGLVRAARRLAGAARRVLPRHAAPRRRGHQRLQGGHAARHLGAGAVPAQRIGPDARSARVPRHATASASFAAT